MLSEARGANLQLTNKYHVYQQPPSYSRGGLQEAPASLILAKTSGFDCQLSRKAVLQETGDTVLTGTLNHAQE